MKKAIDKVDDIIHKISMNFVIILFAVITIGMFIVNSIYLYEDRPTFALNNIWSILGITISVIGVALIFIANKFIEKKFPNKKIVSIILLTLYCIGEIIYLKVVPLKPFSDMLRVIEIASSNFSQGIDYLQIYPNNVPITIIFYILLKIYSGVTIIKIFNIFCNISTIIFAYKIYNNVYKNNNRIVLLLGIFSMSTFLYINHLYNDVIYVLLATIMIYIATKDSYNVKDIIALSVLAFLQYIIRPVGIILIIAVAMYLILKKFDYKTLLIMLITFIICNLIYSQLEKVLIPQSEENPKYPIWSFIQMGLNEEEFGFQDSSHSTKWKAEDVAERINTLGGEAIAGFTC